ncbi:transposase [Streptomyces sp. NPDC096046]|uniref:IS701 family transposase n=1 Tax=Streptomyces sp. NPDC096046 TaxID=3155542 RepID=UPI00332FE7E1
MGPQLVQFKRSHSGPAGPDAVGRLCQGLFDSLPRADQRRKAELYVRGLLTAGGRKTMRNIAAHAGMPAGEQSLHHFISCSTWDWRPVREALAAQLDGLLNLRAWVVKPMVIPKSGAHSVGVERRFDAESGHMVNGQQAFGAWAVSEGASVPVSWALHLPEETTLAGCAARAALDIAEARSLRRLPVVVDAVDGGPELLPDRLGAAGVPFMMEVAAATPLYVTDPRLPGAHGALVTAGRVMEAAGPLRRPVRYEDRANRSVGISFVASLQAELPDQAGPRTAGRRTAPRRPLLLIGEWAEAGRRPDRYWLTDLTTAPPALLMRLAELSRRIERGAVNTADRVGMRDFEGRSFQGWHRHVTLASAAQAALATTAQATEWGGAGQGRGHAMRPGFEGGFDRAVDFAGIGAGGVLAGAAPFGGDGAHAERRRSA